MAPNNRNNNSNKGSQETALGAALAGALSADATVETVNEPISDPIIDKVIEDMTVEQKVYVDLLSKMYGEVECQALDNAVSERFGNKSVGAIEVTVPFPLLGLRVQATIWGRLSNKADGTEIKFEASLPKGMKGLDADGAERFKAHVENGAAAWAGYERATDLAVDKLMGNKSKPIGNTAARPVLVRKITGVGASSPPPMPVDARNELMRAGIRNTSTL